MYLAFFLSADSSTAMPGFGEVTEMCELANELETETSHAVHFPGFYRLSVRLSVCFQTDFVAPLALWHTECRQVEKTKDDVINVQ